MTDITKYSVPVLYNANKNREYRARIIEKSTALMAFLKTEGLLVKDPFDEQGGLKLDLVIKASDLSPEGLALFEKAVHAWLKKQDKGGSRVDVTALQLALADLRKG